MKNTSFDLDQRISQCDAPPPAWPRPDRSVPRRITMSARGPVRLGASGRPATAQKIADHFSCVQTMTGEFVQFGPKGEQTGGKFYMQRPGKIRFNYEAPSGYPGDFRRQVGGHRQQEAQNGRPLSAVEDAAEAAARRPASTSPAARSRASRKRTTSPPSNSPTRSVFGNSTITMMFDPKSYDLRQWTITDAQGKDTTVMIFNVREGVKFDQAIFNRLHAQPGPEQHQQRIDGLAGGPQHGLNIPRKRPLAVRSL